MAPALKSSSLSVKIALDHRLQLYDWSPESNKPIRLIHLWPMLPFIAPKRARKHLVFRYF